jgi:hypothetical protein
LVLTITGFAHALGKKSQGLFQVELYFFKDFLSALLVHTHTRTKNGSLDVSFHLVVQYLVQYPTPNHHFEKYPENTDSERRNLGLENHRLTGIPTIIFDKKQNENIHIKICLAQTRIPGYLKRFMDII